MSEPDSNAEADVPVTRWSRRAVDRPGGSAELPKETADQFASLAERAARLAPPKTVSVRRIDDVFVEPEPATLETAALPKLDTPNDSGTAETGAIDTGATDNSEASAWPAFDASRPLPPTPVLPTTSIEPVDLEPVDLEPVDLEPVHLDPTELGEPAASVDPSEAVVPEPVTLDTASVQAPPAPEVAESADPAAPTEPADPEVSNPEVTNPEVTAPAAPEVATPTENLNLTVAPIQHAMLPAVAEPEPRSNRTGLALLAMATALAVLSGVLGALWLRERSASADLRTQLAEVNATDEVTEQGLASLNDEVRTLRLQNDQLQQQLNDMSALVLELPEGRVTEIAVPFTPLFADEENGRLIAIGESGEYITWGEGADGPITDSGSVSGTPTGLFAATRKAWVSTEAGRIDVLSLVAGEPGLPSVEFGPTMFMAAEERGYWTYDSASSEVVRLRKSDGGITDSVSVPVPIVDLTIGAGSIWALGDDGRVYRINTADLTVQAVDAGEDLIAVTAGPDALWTLSAADGSLRRVDPVTGEVLVTVPVGRDPIDATFAGSSVWVALRSGSSLIEVDTRTSAVVSRTTLPSEPTALHQGDSGVFVTTAGEVPLVRVASLTPVEPEPAEDAEADDS